MVASSGVTFWHFHHVSRLAGFPDPRGAHYFDTGGDLKRDKRVSIAEGPSCMIDHSLASKYLEGKEKTCNEPLESH